MVGITGDNYHVGSDRTPGSQNTWIVAVFNFQHRGLFINGSTQGDGSLGLTNA